MAMVDALAAMLADELAPIAARTRSIYQLKQLHATEENDMQQRIIEAIAHGLNASSTLLSHECAYVLGQMQDPRGLKYLYSALSDYNIDPITRHEAAEGIGSIGQMESIAVLEKFIDDPMVEVRDTVSIALERLNYIKNHHDNSEMLSSSKFQSIDPAPPSTVIDVAQLKDNLADKNLSLFERYRAMFQLRNIGTSEAIKALVAGFESSETSAVFRHEIAYVLGQLAHPDAIDALSSILREPQEHAMTRHEAAEALGAIAGEGEPAVDDILRKYENDEDFIVKQSVQVALDISEFWRSDEVSSALPQAV